MYNPYFEEELEEIPTSFSPIAQDVLSSNSAIGGKGVGDLGGLMEKLNLSSLKGLFSLKDLVSGDKSDKSKKIPKPPLKKEEGGEIQSAGTGILETVKQKLHVEDLEAGDILLLIILIYLMLEGDDKLELAITLGVLALMWLVDGKKEAE